MRSKLVKHYPWLSLSSDREGIFLSCGELRRLGLSDIPSFKIVVFPPLFCGALRRQGLIRRALDRSTSVHLRVHDPCFCPA